MKRIILIIAVLFLTITSNSQTQNKLLDLNSDFENIVNNIPVNWSTAGSINYKTSIDSIFTKSGKYSITIEYNGESPDVGVWMYTIPANYSGKKITLTGYMKTENVTIGWAGLFMRIEPSVALENMQKERVIGTTGWKKYEITLDLNPEKTKQILFGGLLIGNGKVWFDSLNVSIDGADISRLTPIPVKEYAAEIDKEYDKGSNIAEIELDHYKIENLRILGLVWGFLKYYHPSVVLGNYNWDYELFRILPKILGVKDIKERDNIFIEWIDKLGKVDAPNNEEISKTNLKIEPDLDWIKDSSLSTNLSSLLLEMKNAKRTNQNYYASIKEAGNPEFNNENQYATMNFPDAGFRLLALFRYWNIIQYYYPYKNIIGEKWGGVLKEFIPKFLETKNELEYKLTVLEMIARVHDTHANITNDETLNNYFGIKYAPIELTFIENKAVVKDFYDENLGKKCGLQVGDIVTKINNIPIDKIIKDNLKYTCASNYPTQLRNIAPNLLRTNDTVIQVEFYREGNAYSKRITAYSKKNINIYKKYEQHDSCFKLIRPEIGYIYPRTIKNGYLPKIWKAIEKTKGIIIDLRCYPKEYIVYSLGAYLMPDSTEFLKFSLCNKHTPGLFTLTRPFKVGKKNTDYYKGRVIILINEETQSQAEFTTMALRVAPNAKVIGSTTAGADGDISNFYLPGGISTRITGIGIYYPDGRETQRVGIIPDIEIKPTINGVIKGIDEPLEKAIEIITNVK